MLQSDFTWLNFQGKWYADAIASYNKLYLLNCQQAAADSKSFAKNEEAVKMKRMECLKFEKKISRIFLRYLICFNV